MAILISSWLLWHVAAVVLVVLVVTATNRE